MGGRTRGRLIAALASAAAATVLCAAAASFAAPAQRGIFALLSASPRIVSEAWLDASGIVRIRQYYPGVTAPIREYGTDMQKLMHLIVVRDDFATFAHLHPAFDANTGTFTAKVGELSAGHAYYVYADSEPRGVGQQVFRFTMGGGPPRVPHATSLPYAASGPSIRAGRYTVSLARTTLTANRPQNIALMISDDGRPARRLQTYLGAAAHAVFIDTANLVYVHVHPSLRGNGTPTGGMAMEMNDARPGPSLQLESPALPPGSYKLWIEFRGADGAIDTAAFTIRVR